MLDLGYETFVVYVVSLNSTSFDIYSSHWPQILILIFGKALTKVHDKYVNFANVFSLYLTSKFPKYIRMNDYAIKLVDD